MKYMVMESFKPGMSDAVYDRYQAKGRMLPDGLEYLDSCLSADHAKCFQLMQTDNFRLFANWTALWDDLIDFEIVECMGSGLDGLLPKPTIHPSRASGRTVICCTHVSRPFMLSLSKNGIDLGKRPLKSELLSSMGLPTC